MNLHRFLALCHKEFCQMLRDPSSFLIGIVIPLMLIILMGSGLSLDVKDLPVAVALEDSSPTAQHPSLPRRLAIFLTALRIFHK